MNATATSQKQLRERFEDAQPSDLAAEIEQDARRPLNERQLIEVREEYKPRWLRGV